MGKICLVAFLILSLFLLGGFGDAREEQPSVWAADAVNEAFSVGIIPLEMQLNFGRAITREEFGVLIYNFLNTEFWYLLSDDVSNGFEDTNRSEIAELHALGIVTGRTETKFAPNEQISRQEAAVILYRTSRFINAALAPSEHVFADADEVLEFASKAVSMMYAAEIMRGVGGNQFDPLGTLTREQAIVAVMRMYELHSFVRIAFPTHFDDGELLFAVCERAFDAWVGEPYELFVLLKPEFGNASLTIYLDFITPMGSEFLAEMILESEGVIGTVVFDSGYIGYSPLEGVSATSENYGIVHEVWIHRLTRGQGDTGLALAFLLSYEDDIGRNMLYSVLNTMNYI